MALIWGRSVYLPFISKTNSERRVMINSISTPLGRQPSVVNYRRWPLCLRLGRWCMRHRFSSLYVAMCPALISLWLRPLALEYRAKMNPTTNGERWP
ncbi:hypothetical protein O9929_17275 [Vibrio lentus]|nr:hypothetical protein [Vibrio lentus]